MKIYGLMLCLLCAGICPSSNAEIITNFTLTRVVATNFISLRTTVTPTTNYAFESSSDALVWGPASPILSSPSNTLVWQTSECSALSQRFYRVVRPPRFSTNATGRLQSSNGIYTLTTTAGWTIRVSSNYVMRITHPNTNFWYELWGNAHESLKGQHIKDTLSNRRTFLLTDNTIVTATLSSTGTVARISIYDADQSHHINAQTLSVIRSSSVRSYGEPEEFDGETARFVDNADGMRAENYYEQGDPCTGASGEKVFNVVPLGQLYLNSPNRVDDYYDDPRLGHT